MNAASGHGSGSGGRNVPVVRDAAFTVRTGGIGPVIVVCSLARGALVRTLVWVTAVALPIFVGVSRLDRGTHFLTDVIAAVVLGCLALLFRLPITRSVRAAAAERDCHASSPSSPQPQPGVP